MFWRREITEPEISYQYQVFPDNIRDGEHEFDGITIDFSKPGWTWAIVQFKDGLWDKLLSYGDGFPTRDAALVDLLRTAKELENDRVERN